MSRKVWRAAPIAAPLFCHCGQNGQEDKNMNIQDKIELAKKNIWRAIDDYKAMFRKLM